jgi:hypothetical protein
MEWISTKGSNPTDIGFYWTSISGTEKARFQINFWNGEKWLKLNDRITHYSEMSRAETYHKLESFR